MRTKRNKYDLEKIRHLASYQCFLSQYLGGIVDAHSNLYSWGVNAFLSRISSILPAEKYERFLQDFKNDVPDIYDTLFLELGGAFYAEDRFINVFFHDEKADHDFTNFRIDVLKDDRFMRERVMPETVISPNTVLCMVPENGSFTHDLFNPFQIDDYSEKDNNFEFIVLNLSKGFLQITPENYQILNSKYEPEGDPIVNPWGYVPCVFLSNKILENSRRKPITYGTIPQLTRFISHQNNRDYSDLFTSYPIIETPEIRCTYKDAHGGQCNDGFIKYKTGTGGDQYSVKACPSCAKSKLLGPGTHIKKPNSLAGTGPAVALHNVDANSLKYNQSKTAELKTGIVISLVGLSAQAFSNDAYNELQVDALNAKKVETLRNFADILEKTHGFLLTVYAELLHPQTFDRAVVEYGRTMIVKSYDQLIGEFVQMRAAGAPQTLLTNQLKKAIRVQYRTNPMAQKRFEILYALEPYPNLSTAEIIDLYKSGIIDIEILNKKLNWPKLIGAFQNKYGRIELFGANNPNKEKILQTIDQEFDRLNKQMYDTRRIKSSDGGPEKIQGRESNQ